MNSTEYYEGYHSFKARMKIEDYTQKILEAKERIQWISEQE